MEVLSAIGMIILIVIGVLIITLLTYALRLLIIIYGFFGSTRPKGESPQSESAGLSSFIKGASVIEIILFLLRSRGRFRR